MDKQDVLDFVTLNNAETEMTDKLILRSLFKCGMNDVGKICDGNCPYWNREDEATLYCRKKLINDAAISLRDNMAMVINMNLELDELRRIKNMYAPRILTPMEIFAKFYEDDGIPVWIEHKNKDALDCQFDRYIFIANADFSAKERLPFIETDSGDEYALFNYERTWRLWNVKPEKNKPWLKKPLKLIFEEE